MRSRIADTRVILISAAWVAGVWAGALWASPASAQRVLIRETDTLRIVRPDPPEPPEVPGAPGVGEVRIEIRENGDTSRTVVIRSNRKRATDDLVRMGENVTIGADQVVDGDVVAIGGSVTVHGRVRGDAVAIGGNVSLRGAGAIDGDAVSIGGTVRQDPGTRLGGQNVGLRVVPSGIFSGDRGGRGLFAAFLGIPILLIFLFLIGWLLAVLADRRLRGMGEYVQEHLWRSLITGLAVIILSPAAFVLLLVTIVGIPLAFLLPVVLPIAHLIGFLVVATLVGVRVLQRTGTSRSDWVKAMGVGLLVYLGIPLLGYLGHAVGGLLGFLGTVLIVFGLAASYISATIGLGALVLSRFGSPRRARAADVPPSHSVQSAPA